MELKSACLLLLLLVYTDISLSATPSCKSGCRGSKHNLVKLQEGTTYVYNLEGNTETSIPKTSGPNGESTRLGIRAKVEVNAQAGCATLIRLKNVQIIGPDDKKYGSLNKLEQNPIRVSLNGGALDQEICTVPEDDYTSLNIKRAVASLLNIHNDETGLLNGEVDVFGVCNTDYKIHKEGDSTVVRKVRDLSKCAHREKIQSEIFSISNVGSSLLQSSPFLDPTYEAEIKLKGGIVDSATVRESYLYRPFSNGANGAKTVVTTKLTLAGKSGGAIPDTTKEPRSIIFESPHEQVSSSIQTVIAALHKVVDNTDKSVDNSAARNFGELVAIVRRASAEDLLSVYGQVKAGAGFKNKQLARKVFSDALYKSGSSDSISVAIELLKSRQIEDNFARLWFLSFAFARHVSAASLEKATGLLDDASLPREAYLGVGALAGRYCHEHACDNVPAFQNLQAKLAAPLANPVPTTRAEEYKIVAALKGLRNSKRLSDDAAGKVAAVIKESKAPTRVRAAALETAFSDACKSKLKKAAQDVLSNIEEDAELRIKAYLVLVECPGPKTANKLSEMIETEPVNQVGAFITSHLRNLRASANPDHQAARALLQNVKPRKRFPIDVRRFSQNFEGSFDIDALGASASAESNVIFSQDSYIPRSANLNLTAEVFGHNFNLFEISGRAENLERIVERVFGPRGYVRSNKPEDIYKDAENNIKKLKEQVEDKIKNLSRSKRSATKDQINDFAKNVKLHQAELDDNVDLDVSLSLLGNELLWVNLGGKEDAKELIDELSQIIEKGVGKVKKFDHDIQSHSRFLDTELSYPTSSGLPIKLTATATSVVHLKLAGNLNSWNPFKVPKNEEFKLDVRPSAAVEVIGSLTVDGYAVEAGLKVATTLHTATGTDITFKLLDGKGFDLNIGLPVKESDILSINNEILVAVRERGQPLATTPLEFKVPRKDFEGCFDQLLPLIGLTLCGKIGFPNDPSPITSGAALYPLNGKSHVSLRLVKDDPSLTSYHIRFVTSLDDVTNRRIELLLETPGSSNPRELSLLAEAKTVPDKEINLKIVTPIYKALGQAKVVDTDKEYSLSGLAEIEGIFSYKTRLGLLINGVTYTPVFEYSGPDGVLAKAVNVEGSVTVEKSAGSPKKKFTFNNVRITSEGGKVSVDGTVNTDSNFLQTDLKLKINEDEVAVKSKFQRQGDNNLKLGLEVVPSKFQDISFAVKYEYQRDKKHIENSFSLVHGPDLTSKESRLSILQQLTFNVESATRFDITTKNSLSYPLFGVEGKLDGTATQSSVSYDFLLGNYVTVKSKLLAKTGVNKPGDYDVDFSAAAGEHSVRVESKREIVAPNKSKFTNSLVITPGGRYALDADVTHQLDKNNIDTRLAIALTLEGEPKPFIIDLGTIYNPSTLEAHSKIEARGVTLLEAEIKQKRSEPKSGSFKFNLKRVLESSGDYQRSEGKSNAKAEFFIIPVARRIKGSADLTITGPKHAGSIEILFNADKDPNQKISIQTDTDLTTKSINSKNKVQAGSKEAIVNFNGEASGRPGNGAVSGGCDITLPNGVHLVGRGKHALNLVPHNGNGELFIDVGYSLSPGSPLNKYTLDAYAKNVDARRYAFDTKFELKSVCPQGDLYFTQVIKNTPQDGKYLLEAQNAVGGSRLGEYQYNGKAKAAISRDEITYTGSSALGQKYTAQVEGKIKPGLEDRVYAVEYKAHLTTPVESFKDIKQQGKLRVQIGTETRPCQITYADELNLDGKVYKATLDTSAAKNEGTIKTTVAVASIADPFSAQINYKHNHDNNIIKSEVSLDARQGENNANLNLKADYTKDAALVNTHLTGSTSHPSAKKIDIAAGYKKISSVSASGEVKATLNDDNLELSGKVDLSPNHPLTDINGVYNGQKYRSYWKLDRNSDRQFSQEGQIIKGDQQFDYSINVDVQDLENFLVSGKFDGEKYNLNKLKIEFGNRPAKASGAKKVTLTVADASGKILSGSANYAIKENANGFSIEGKGTVTYKNEEHPLTYKFSSNRLTQEANKESGLEGKVSVDYGIGSFNQEAKRTDKEFKIKQILCHNKKCNELDLLSKAVIDGHAKQKAEFVLKYSNELFATPYKVGVVSKTERNGLNLNSENTATIRDVTYSARAYNKPNEAGVVINVPTREIAAIAAYSLPEPKKDAASAKIDVSLALDRKKNPNDKAALILEASATNKNKVISGNAVAKFTHPALARELSITGKGTVGLDKTLLSGNVDIDVFNKKNQKISVSVEVEQNIVDIGRNISGKAVLLSKGLVLDIGGTGHIYASRAGASAGAFAYYVDDKNMKKEFGASGSVARDNSAILVKLPSVEVLNGNAKTTLTGDDKSIEAQLTILEIDTAVLNVHAVKGKKLHACLHPKSRPDRKLELLLELDSEAFKARVERTDGKKETLVATTVYLSREKLFKVDYDLQAENIKKSIEYFAGLARTILEKARSVSESLSKELNKELINLAEAFKKAQPNLKPIIEQYQKTFKAIRDELEKDKNYQALSGVLKKLLGGSIDAIEIQIRAIIKIFETIAKEVTVIQDKLIEAYKKIAPDAIEAYKKLLDIFTESAKNLIQIFKTVADQILDEVRKYEPELKKVVEEFGHLFSDIANVGLKNLEQLRHEISDALRLLWEQIENLPIYNNAKLRIEEWSNLELPPHFWELFNELRITAEETAPSDELRQAIKSIFDYIEKLLRHESVDHVKAISTIASELRTAITNILLSTTGVDIQDLFKFNFDFTLPVPRPALSVLKLPDIGQVRFSPFSLLAAFSDLPSPSELYYAYKPSLNPLTQIPPFTGTGIILNSHHFFTFDKKHFAFKGSCSYVLAQDFQDGNFSIVANLENGKLKSLTIADRTDVIELLNDNTVIVNGKAGDFPVQTDELDGWRRYKSVNIKLKSGVFVTRYLPADIYTIFVSGFYHGRTRGLLGTLNNEQYDEMTLPNGHIAKDVAEFGNAYKLTSCANVPSVKAASPHAPECTSFFTSDSSLRNYFGFLTPEPFREACDEHAAMTPGQGKKVACEVAAAYVSALRAQGLLFPTVPSECAQCTVGAKKLELGQSEQIESPAGKADVILVLEQSTYNQAVFKELVTPLIATLSTDLKEKGINDVEFALIGYGGPHKKWPQHYGNNGKVTYEGKSEGLTFADAEVLSPPYDTLSKKAKYVYKFISTELGLDQIVIAMNEANLYPFRQGAAKIITLINSTPCPRSPIFPISIQIPRSINIYRFYRERGLKFFSITPLAGISIDKPDGKAKQVVGFDSDKVYYLSDAKKIVGDAADRQLLKYEGDLCLAFTHYYGNAAFSSQNFLDAKPDQKKKFVQVVSQRIVQEAVQYKYTEDCTCTLKSGRFPYADCTVSSRETKS